MNPIHASAVALRPSPRKAAPGPRVAPRRVDPWPTRGKISDCPCGGVCPRCRSAAVVPADALGPGEALPADCRDDFSARLGTDLHAVRVHTGGRAAANADAVHARAYTRGSHIVFAAGRFRPDSPEGRTLLAHELIHTVQQGNESSQSEAIAPRNHSSEEEARRGAERLAAGGSFRPQQRANGMLQRDDNDSPPASGRAAPLSSQLQLDPAFMAEMRLFLAQSIASRAGTVSLTTPLPPLTTSGSTPTPSPNLFSPLPSDPTFVPPDYTSLYGPYNDRGVPIPGRERDAPVIDQLYRDRWNLVRGLPDLRSWAPPALRSLIPNTWRRDLASALTGLTVDSALKRDNPTPIEAADQFLMKVTGDKNAVPTYINPPFKPFKWEF